VDLYNTRIHKGESVRVFPLSNWTELGRLAVHLPREDSSAVAVLRRRNVPVVERDWRIDHGD
jgi:sulfate adenylyltransferase subunit 2